MTVYYMFIFLISVCCFTVLVMNLKNEDTCKKSNKKCSNLNECCNHHSECCSQYCDFNSFLGFKGYCTDSSKILEILKLRSSAQSIDTNEDVDCKPIGNNLCFVDEDCCSNYCYVKTGFRYGECRYKDDNKNEDSSEKSIELPNKSPKNSKQKNEKIDNYYKNKADQVKICTYYTFKGRTASGEPYRENEFTAAHKYLPFNTTVMVKINDQQVTVRINDRSPYNGEQILNLSLAAAKKLLILKDGISPCKVKIIHLTENYRPTTPDYRICMYLFSNKCTKDEDCCSQYCEKLTEWITGICRPKLDIPTIE